MTDAETNPQDEPQAEATRKKSRSRMLAELRKANRQQVSETQLMLKRQQRTRKALRRALQVPRSVPQLAEEIDEPTDVVLWHIAAMKKYGEVVEDGLDEEYEYYLYRLAKEVGA